MTTSQNQPRKAIKKVGRVLLWTLLVLLLIPVLISLALLLPPVQKAAVFRLASLGSGYLGTEITLEGVYLDPFHTIRLNGILVRDQQSDTLLYVESLEVDGPRYSRDRGELGFDAIRLVRPYFNLYIQEQDSVSNLQFIIDAFSSEDTASSTFRARTRSITIQEFRFAFDDHREIPRIDGGLDWKHIGIYELSGRFNEVALNDSIKFQVKGLHLREQSGMRIRSLYTDAVIAKDRIVCDELHLATNLSTVEGSAALYFDGFSSFSNFFEDVSLQANFNKARVHFYDVGYFSPQVKDILTPIGLKMRAWGTLEDLRTEIDSLAFANNGSMVGSVRMRGLPDPDELRINADVQHLTFRIDDLERMYFPSSEGIRLLELPSSLKNLGRIDFEGKFLGFAQDFVLYGDVGTALGNAFTDVNIKMGGEELVYSGKVKTEGFHLGALMESSGIGNVSLDIAANGQGTSMDDLSIKAEGSIKRFEWNNYPYRNLTVDATIDHEVFEGNLSIADPNIRMDFIGTVDLKKETPRIDCVSRLTKLRWAPLNLVPQDTFGELSAEITLSASGKDAASLNAKALLYDFVYRSKDTDIHLDSITLVDKPTKVGHSITLTSDGVQAKFSGNTDVSTLPTALMLTLDHYAPGLIPEVESSPKDSTLYTNFSITIPKETPLTGLVSEDLKLHEPICIKGAVQVKDHKFDVRSDSLSWSYGNVMISGQSFEVQPVGDSLVLDIYTTRFASSDQFFMENILLSSALANDTVRTDLSWDNKSTRSDSGHLALLAYKGEDRPINVELEDLYARIADATWVSNERGVLRSDSTSFLIHNLNIQSRVGHITCDGLIDPQSEQRMVFEVADFDLSYLDRFGLLANKVTGVFNGDVFLYGVESRLLAESELRIDSLVLDDFEIGTVYGTSEYNSSQNSVDLDLALKYKGSDDIKLKGDYYPAREDDQLDLEVSLSDFRASVIEPFVQNYVQHLDGTVDGRLAVRGRLTSPEITGILDLKGFDLEVDYLKTDYHISKARINVDAESIKADWIEVKDPKGEKGYLIGTVYHNGFKSFDYDIFMQVTNFMALNTTLADNQDYYGVANITGDISLSGTYGYTDINVEAVTTKGTKLSVPLDDGGELGEIDYIRFVAPKVMGKKRIEEGVTLSEEQSKLNLEFQLTVNDNAEVQIIFDEKIGDIIKVRGDGDMLMRIDNRGTFNMYGDYTMSGGEYLFTLQNVVNKRFSVQPGSRISWTGSPTEADVDLTAVYGLRAAPINLTATVGEKSPVYEKRLPVDVLLMMQGLLLKPQVSFDVNLTSLPETDIANQLLDRRTVSKEKMNEQAFALLLTNSFFSPESGVSAIGAGQTTTYEMVSNQFSNWVSQYFDNLDVGVNYRPGDDMAGNQTEVNLSTELFNDRVLVEVNGSVQGDRGDAEEANNVAGEFNVEYRINKSLRARVYNEANNYNPTNINQSPYTQGVGLFYRREFDRFLSDFFKGNKERSLAE